jgi:hypothetical protein
VLLLGLNFICDEMGEGGNEWLFGKKYTMVQYILYHTYLSNCTGMKFMTRACVVEFEQKAPVQREFLRSHSTKSSLFKKSELKIKRSSMCTSLYASKTKKHFARTRGWA